LLDAHGLPSHATAKAAAQPDVETIMRIGWIDTLLVAMAAAVLSWGLIGLYVRSKPLSSRPSLPNERSMHVTPIPVGAGIAMVAVILVLWIASEWTALQRQHAVLTVACACLGILSWVDDRYPLPPVSRMTAQAIAVAFCIALLPGDIRAAPFLPMLVERLLMAVAWLWFINLFNFMDGIDGLAGSEAVAVALGYVLVALLAGHAGPLSSLALIIAAASAAYLLWNWHPAKVFMGDAGAVPLGFLLGWLMIDLATRGNWAAAVLLPLYFAADATITLAKRTLRGESPSTPHREHYYQRAVLGGATPRKVITGVAAVNAVLIALAALSLNLPVPSAIAGMVVVAGLLGYLEKLAANEHS
jgi:UDP-N-acetylmuramyl pentapeptide phosphotransferase/UDP-N-acetylglucosamine-1-phosphate transferase